MKGIYVSSLRVVVQSVTFFEDGGSRLTIQRGGDLDRPNVLPWVQRVFPGASYVEIHEIGGDRFTIRATPAKRKSLL